MADKFSKKVDSLFDHRVDCFCAFCKTPRKVYRKKSLSAVNVLASLFGSLIIMYFVWRDFDPRFMLIFVGFLAISEIFVQFRWRVTIACKHCGFDPVLYLKNSALAAEKVRNRLAERENSAAAVLAAPLKIPKITKVRAEEVAKAQSGQRLSKTI